MPAVCLSVCLSQALPALGERLGMHVGNGEPSSRTGLLEHLTPELAADAARLITCAASYVFQTRGMTAASSVIDPAAPALAPRSSTFQVVPLGATRTRLDPAWDAMRELSAGLYASFETDTRADRLHEAYP